jgi:hypothetical protein
MRKTSLPLGAIAALALAGFAPAAFAQTYEIIVTNVTAGQTFTPFLAANHTPEIKFFRAGRPARPELAQLAEGGDVAPLQSLLASTPDRVFATATSDGLLGPGESVTFTIDTGDGFRRLSLAAMLIPTNDTFVALDNVRLPERAETHFLTAYDAGSEENDELCANIPGPVCGGEGVSEADGEGFVHVSRGIQGIADLDAAAYDWRNPVARVRVRLVEAEPATP